VGFAVGNAQLVGGLASAKGNLDSGVVSAIQEMGITALKAPASLAKACARSMPSAARSWWAA